MHPHLLQLLDNYASRYPEESETVERFRRFVEENEDCFERSLQQGHITGSAWIIDEAGRRTLLTHHAKLNLWLQTGGHADGNTDALAVARLEAEEESGLQTLDTVSSEIFDLDIHPIPERPNEPAHFHYDVRFLLRNTGDEQYIVSEESHDLAWVAMDKLEDYTTEHSMLRMRDKALALATKIS